MAFNLLRRGRLTGDNMKTKNKLEKAAKEQTKSVDDSLKEGFDNPTFKAANIPETRYEKIEGDNATLEVLDADTKKWEKLYFVKEDNDWKLALDKIIEEAFKNLGK